MADGAALPETLCRELRRDLGDDGVLTDPADRAGYETDLLHTRTGRALAIVRPRSTSEVATVVRSCAEAGVAIVPQGGNTGFCQGATPPDDGSAIVLSLERLRAIRAVDLAGSTMVVEAGVSLADARAEAASHGRLLAIHHGGLSSTIGGNVSTNAGGNNVLRYGMARSQILGLEVVLADGQIWNGLGALAKDNAGTDLKQLFIGTEGTLGIVTAATLRLFPAATRSATALIAVSSVPAALALLTRLQAAAGDAITAAELIPRTGLDLHFAHIGRTREPFEAVHPWQVLVELTAASRFFDLDAALEAAVGAALEAGEALDAVQATSEAQRASLWALREGLAVAQVRTPGNLKNDTSVPVASIPRFIERATRAVAGVAPRAVPIPFGHLGDGNIPFNVNPPPGSDGIAFKTHWPELAASIDAVAGALGGSIAAEHGLGRSKVGAAARLKPALDLDLMRRLKRALDPEGRFNPGVMLGPED
ncbi:MAG: FAD-binding oxidoreductase [Thalassobaculaceae bacterium]|nr:FAD-binding oxidoreductase [Thalassobaculaceae bacterium]